MAPPIKVQCGHDIVVEVESVEQAAELVRQLTQPAGKPSVNGHAKPAARRERTRLPAENPRPLQALQVLQERETLLASDLAKALDLSSGKALGNLYMHIQKALDPLRIDAEDVITRTRDKGKNRVWSYGPRLEEALKELKALHEGRKQES